MYTCFFGEALLGNTDAAFCRKKTIFNTTVVNWVTGCEGGFITLSKIKLLYHEGCYRYPVILT